MIFLFSAVALAGGNLATCQTITLDGEASWEDFRLEAGDPCEGHLFRGEEKLTESCATTATICDAAGGRYVVAAAFGASSVIDLKTGAETAVPGQAWAQLVATGSAVLLPFDDAVASGSTHLLRVAPEAGLVYALASGGARENATLEIDTVAVDGDAVRFEADVTCDARVYENDGQPLPARCVDASGAPVSVGRLSVALDPKTMEAEVTRSVELQAALGGARIGEALDARWSVGEKPGQSVCDGALGEVSVTLSASVEGGVIKGLAAEVKPADVEAAHDWALEAWGRPDAQEAIGSRLQWIWRRADCTWKWVQNGEGEPATASINCD